MSRPKIPIAYLPVEKLVPSPRNARTHSRKQKAEFADSINRFGIVTLVGIGPTNELIYGHARVEAARLAGLTEVPVIRLNHLTADERRAYLLADNRLALDAGWDRELLALELKELAALDFSLPALGFSLPEIDKLYEDLDDARIDGSDALDDEIVPLPEFPVTQDDYMWQLGNHGLIRGDARKDGVHDRLLEDQKVGVIFTDPPYNVKIEGNVSGLGKVRYADFAMASTELSSEQYEEFLVDSFTPAAKRCRDGAIAFICIAWRHMNELNQAGMRVFDELKNVCIWNKKNAAMGTFYRSRYEMVFVFKKGSAPHLNTFGLGESGRHCSIVWDYAGVSGLLKNGVDELAMHPTVKPVALIVNALKDCSARGDIVLDNFGGSGSTLIAERRNGSEFTTSYRL